MMDPVVFTVAGLLAGVQTKTTNYTTVAGDDGFLFEVDTSAGAVVITLLAAATGGSGYRVAVRKSTSDANTVTVNTVGSGANVLLDIGDALIAYSDATTYKTLAFCGPDVRAIDALTSTGMPARTAASTWALRTLTGTANQIDVTNGNGVSGNPTFSLSATLVLTGITTSVRDDRFTIEGSADATKKLVTQVDTQATGSTLTLDVGAQTTSRTLTVPVMGASDTLATLAVANIFSATQRMNAADALLLGTSVNAGNGAIQIAAGTTKANGVAFGTDCFFFRNAANEMRLDTASLSIDRGSGFPPYSIGTHISMWGANSTAVTVVAAVFGSTVGCAWSFSNTGGTRASQSATPDASSFFTISCTGFGTTITGERAAYAVLSDGLWSAGNNGTKHLWLGTNNGSTTEATWMSLVSGALTVSTAGITHASATLLTTTVNLTNGAGVAAGTLLNAPAAGNPTKWIPINDNGTTRHVPAW